MSNTGKYSTLSKSKCNTLKEETNSSVNHKCGCASDGTVYSYDTRFFECRPYGLFLRKHTEETIQPLLKELHRFEKQSFSPEIFDKTIVKSKIEELFKQYEKIIQIEAPTKQFIIDYIVDTDKDKNDYNLFQMVSSLENIIKYSEKTEANVSSIKQMISQWIQGSMNTDVSIEQQVVSNSPTDIQSPVVEKVPGIVEKPRDVVEKVPGIVEKPRDVVEKALGFTNEPTSKINVPNKLEEVALQQINKNIPKLYFYINAIEPKFTSINSQDLIQTTLTDLDDIEKAKKKYTSTLRRQKITINDALYILKSIPSVNILYQYSQRIIKTKPEMSKQLLYFILFSDFIENIEEDIQSTDSIKTIETYISQNKETLEPIFKSFTTFFEKSNFHDDSESDAFQKIVDKLNDSIESLDE